MKVFIRLLICICVWVCCVDLSLQAQQHRTFNSAVAKQASLGHYTKPVYSLNGRTHTHTHNGLMMDDDTGDEEEADEEVKKHCVYLGVTESDHTVACFVAARCSWKMQ